MSAISKLTAVVPVISKADTYTAKEMEDFKKEIMQVNRKQQGQPA
jgi:septin family protein